MSYLRLELAYLPSNGKSEWCPKEKMFLLKMHSAKKNWSYGGEQDGLTGISGQLGITAGLQDVVGRNVACCWLGPFRFHPQLAVVFQDLSCSCQSNFWVQSLERRGGKVLFLIIANVPSIAGVPGKLMETGGLLILQRNRVDFWAFFNEALRKEALLPRHGLAHLTTCLMYY